MKWISSRAAVLVAAFLVFIITLVIFAGLSTPTVMVVAALDGMIAVLWTLGAAGLGAFLLRLFRVECNSMLRFATSAGLGLGLFSIVILLLGLAGLFHRAEAIALPVMGCVLYVICRLRSHHVPRVQMKEALLKPAGLSWFWLFPAASLAIAIVSASIMPGVLWKPLDPHPYDVISYHLQVPREWYEAGKIIALPHNVFSYFPFVAEMQFLGLMHAAGGPWVAMYSCQFLVVIDAVLLCLAIAGSTDSKNGAIGAAIVSVVPWVVMLAGTAYVESALMLYTALALAWAMRALTWKTITVAGVMAGFACGVKITAVPMLLLAIPIALGILKLATPRETIKWSHLAMFVLVGLLVLSPWLIRNQIWAHNPLFPLAMKTLGQAHFSDAQVDRFIHAHSPTVLQNSALSRLKIVWTDILAHWQYGFALFPVAIISVLVGRKNRSILFLLTIAAVIFITWIGFTHLLARFLVMLVPVAGMMISQVNWQKRWPIALVAVIAIGTTMAYHLYPRVADNTHDEVRSHFVGVQELSFMVPVELDDMKNPDKQVYLIGDAGAFLYQIPMARLHYRTVFDIPADIENPIAAWAGAPAEHNPNSLLVINPSEIIRLHRTYSHTPVPDAKWKTGDEPFIVRGH